MTKIDIILPYFNGSKYVKEQLESVLQNELEDISLNLIVINDASSKEETAFLKRVLPPTALYVENEENLGVVKSIEKGLRLSTAPYIMFCDQDDIWLRQKIRRSLKKIQENENDKPAIVYTDLVISGPNLERLQPSMHAYYGHNHSILRPSIIFHNIVTGCTVIMNRKVLELALPFPPEITMHDHWLAMCATFGGNITLLNEATILYRQHEQNQIGAPNESLILKLFAFQKTFPKFRRHLRMKILMVRVLSSRLREFGIQKEADFLEKTVEAIDNKDIFFLINSGAISGKFVRIFSVASMIIFSKKSSL